MDEVLTDPIICFLKVKFNSHQTWLSFSGLETVQNFLNNDLILGNPSVGDESKLSWRNNFVEKRSELCHQNT